MNNVSILAIVNCAFQICFFYLLKCLVPPIKLGSHISLCSSQDYDKQMNKSIRKLKLILSEVNDPDAMGCGDEGIWNTDRQPNIKDIKDKIAKGHKDCYDNDAEVTFTYENCNNDGNDTVYSLKIKEIGSGEPKKGNYACSEIYVNKADRTFNVMTEEGFKTFALCPKSIVRSERSQ